MEQMTAKYIVHLRLLQEVHKFCNILVKHRLEEEEEESFVDEEHKRIMFDYLNKSDHSEVPMISVIPIPYQGRWLNLFYNSYKASNALNETKILQQSSYQQQGLTEQIPLLIEVISFSSYLQLLFCIYSVFGDSRVNSNVIIHDKLIPLCMTILKSFVRSELESKYQNKILTIVIMIYKELMKISGWQHPKGSNKKLTLKDTDGDLSETPNIISNENVQASNEYHRQENAIPEEQGGTQASPATTSHPVDSSTGGEEASSIIDYPELWDGIRKEIPNFFKYSVPIVHII